MIKGFIPRHVGNRTVLGTLDAMRRGEKNMHGLLRSNYANNRFAIRNHRDSIRRAHGLVEDQKNYTDMKFGKVTMAYAGCEVFAAGNALRTLTGRQVNYPKLIDRFERDGMILLGGFGTAPKAISEFFEECGYETELVTHEELFDSVAAVNDVSILTLYNDGEDIMQKVHTVCVTREKDGYYAHNVYCDGTVVGPCKTIMQMLSDINVGRSKGISLIGIS